MTFLDVLPQALTSCHRRDYRRGHLFIIMAAKMMDGAIELATHADGNDNGAWRHDADY